MVRALGHTPQSWARDSIAREGGPQNARRPFTPDIDVPGPYKGRGNDHPTGQRLGDILTRLMSHDVAVIGAEYDRAVHVCHAGNVTGWGRPFAEAQWMQFRSAFPDAVFRIDHQIGRTDLGEPDRAAIRWSLSGTIPALAPGARQLAYLSTSWVSRKPSSDHGACDANSRSGTKCRSGSRFFSPAPNTAMANRRDSL